MLICSSCCSDDKQCPAGNYSSYQPFPYVVGEKLVFANSLNRKLYVELNDQVVQSAPYTIKGSCASEQPTRTCEYMVSLSAKSVSDSSDAISQANEGFAVSIDGNDNHGTYPSYWLRAFGTVAFGLYQYGTINKPEEAVIQAMYQTPYKTYSNVYVHRPLSSTANYPPYERNKFVVDSKGRLISFSINQDTTDMFHLVE